MNTYPPIETYQPYPFRDPSPIAVILCYDPTANEPYEDYRFTGRRQVVRDISKLHNRCVDAAELGFKRIMLHTMVGGKTGHHISCGLDALPMAWLKQLGNLVRGMREAYGVEIIPHFGHRWICDARTTAGPPTELAHKYPSMFDGSTAGELRLAAIRSMLRDLGVRMWSADNSMNGQVRDFAGREIKEWNHHAHVRPIRIIAEATPLNADGSIHHLAHEIPTWVLAETMIERKGLAGRDFKDTGVLEPLPASMCGLAGTLYLATNPKVDIRKDFHYQLTTHSDVLSEIIHAGWIPMCDDFQVLADACDLARIDRGTGLPLDAQPKTSLNRSVGTRRTVDPELRDKVRKARALLDQINYDLNSDDESEA